jgi:hypothetical protein
MKPILEYCVSNCLPRQLARRLGVAMLCIFGLAQCTSAQTRIEQRASAELHKLLEASADESLTVVRDSSPSFFPSVVFYRADRFPCIDCWPRAAAVAVVRDSLLVIRDSTDRSALWTSAGPSRVVDPAELRRGCQELLYQTGVVRIKDGLIIAASALSPIDRQLLSPTTALEKIGPPVDRSNQDGTISTSYFLSGSGTITHVACAMSRDRQLHLHVDTVAISRLRSK